MRLLASRPLITLLTLGVALVLRDVVAEDESRAAATTDSNVSFDRDISPILVANCYECHGPDESAREAGLRLDDPAAAKGELESGGIAIVPGNSKLSSLVARITAAGDQRMPPADSKQQLTAEQIETLRRWIDQGAVWEQHWSFRPLSSDDVMIEPDDWSYNRIDSFILSALRNSGLEPAVKADRWTLVRRAYYDLLGIPPTPAQARAFVDDPRPNAFAMLIDRLLASPHYGERWGRHWLDVARYGDSNGGDENHAYPLAHRYRDYVIEIFNDDLPYDRFIHQQLAGDLLDADNDRLLRHQLTATGFLALGMKILAEKDPVKKQADIVDEQLDTIGRAFLGLSIGCARCHDHKFDPITARDYYALAGILHSTKLHDRAVETRNYLEQKRKFDEQLAQATTKVTAAQNILNVRIGDTAITREAESFDRGNVSVITAGYGEGIGIISDPGAQQNFAEYDLVLADAGAYLVQLRYAAQVARPGKLSINGKVVSESVISKTTGTWMPDSQRWFSEGVFDFAAGDNVIRVESEPNMSHIDKLRIIAADDSQDIVALIDQHDELTKSLTDLQSQAPKPATVMGATDGEIKNVRMHHRGSHLDLGDEIPRRFIASLNGPSNRLPDSQSGRLQLARWLTDAKLGAAPITSRVMVNRIWNWHFGHGLVATPDDFGTRGEHPTHPQLLDYLSRRFQQTDWSLKSMHRLIMNSSTYQMASQVNHQRASVIDPANRLYWKQNRRRLESEAIRDTMLLHAGRLSTEMGHAPLNVKTQDPSPMDLQKNQATYDGSRRRSVYLPIVRTNVYEFLTLFDFPNAATPVGKRNDTTVPTQALLLMNSPFVVQRSEELARRTLASGPDDSTRLRQLQTRLLTREPIESDIESGLRFLRRYRATIDDPSDQLSAWQAYCQVLLVSNEALYLD